MAQEQGVGQMLYRFSKFCISWAFFTFLCISKIAVFKFFVSYSYHGNKKRPTEVGMDHRSADLHEHYNIKKDPTEVRSEPNKGNYFPFYLFVGFL